MPAHAPPARPTAGYTVMSWHCVSARGAKGDATPYCLASASTCLRYEVVSALLDDACNCGSAATALVKLTRAESACVTGDASVTAATATATTASTARRWATAAAGSRHGHRRGPRSALTLKTFANESTYDDAPRGVSRRRLRPARV